MPFPNFHACRMIDPKKFDPKSFRVKKRDNEQWPKPGGRKRNINLIIGKLKRKNKPSDPTKLQAFRYPKDEWTEAEAKAHCQHNGGILFEAAAEKKRILENLKEHNNGFKYVNASFVGDEDNCLSVDLDAITSVKFDSKTMSIKELFIRVTELEACEEWLDENMDTIGTLIFDAEREEDKKGGKENQRIAYLRVLNYRQSEEKRILTVALVSDRIDRFGTAFNPDGCVTDFRNVVVDFNHSGRSTGAKLMNKRVEIIQLDDGSRVRALLGEVEVYRDSVLRDETGNEIENAYEAVNNGRIISVSIYYELEDDNQEFVNNAGQKIFNKWRLLALSLLDKIPGQEDSIILNIRSFKSNLSNKRTMDQKELKSKIEELLKSKNVEYESISGIILQFKDEENSGVLKFLVDQVKNEVNFEVKEGEVTLLSDTHKVVDDIEDEEEEREDQDSEKKRAYIGQFIKDKNGKLAQVMSIETTEEEGVMKSTVEAETPAGEKITIKGSDIGYAYEEDPEKPWQPVDSDILLMDLIKKVGIDTQEPAGEPETPEGESLSKDKKKKEGKQRSKKNKKKDEAKKLKRELKEKDEEIKKHKRMHKKLKNSPKMTRSDEGDPATDLEGDSEDAQDIMNMSEEEAYESAMANQVI